MTTLVHGYRKAVFRSWFAQAAEAAYTVLTSAMFLSAMLVSAPWIAAFVWFYA
jgi:hypothetical protein